MIAFACMVQFDYLRCQVARLYWSNGYRACWHSGTPHSLEAVYRFATFHLNKIDLSPVPVPVTIDGKGEVMQNIPVMTLLKSTIELSVPDWVEQGRRLGGLLIGVASQTARPLSLAQEWAPIAKIALKANAAM